MGIIGAVDLLSNTNVTAEQVELVEIVKKSSQMMDKLVNQILNINKIDVEKMELETLSINIIDTLDNVIKLAKIQAEQKGLQFIVVYPKNNFTFIGDPLRLSQILSNLLNNAVKFTSKGSITTVMEFKDNSIIIKVSDTGIGISEEHLGKLYKPFTQGNVDTSRIYGGFELGLNICMRLTTLMGGNIVVTSEVNIGTTFTVTIPIRYK